MSPYSCNVSIRCMHPSDRHKGVRMALVLMVVVVVVVVVDLFDF